MIMTFMIPDIGMQYTVVYIQICGRYTITPPRAIITIYCTGYTYLTQCKQFSADEMKQVSVTVVWDPTCKPCVYLAAVVLYCMHQKEKCKPPLYN